MRHKKNLYPHRQVYESGSWFTPDRNWVDDRGYKSAVLPIEGDASDIFNKISQNADLFNKLALAQFDHDYSNPHQRQPNHSFVKNAFHLLRYLR